VCTVGDLGFGTMTGMASGTGVSNAVTAPRLGEVVTLRFDGREVVVWWGPDGDIDRLAVQAGRVLTWPTADACEEHARRAGWAGLGDEDGDDGIGRSTLDFEPVQAWLRGQRTTPAPNSALDLWNFAGDVAASLGIPWTDRGRLADRCYRKLVAANVPYMFDLTSYQPRWLANELRCIRQVLNSAVHLLRTTLG
jgi:hypothetical protein